MAKSNAWPIYFFSFWKHCLLLSFQTGGTQNEIGEQFPPPVEEKQEDHTYDVYYRMPETGSNQPQPRNDTNRAAETLETPWGTLDTYYVGGENDL